MKLFLLVTLTMCAFAGNSVLNRLGVGQLGMDPMGFAVVRVLAGAVTLFVLVSLRRGGLQLSGWPRWGGAASLAIYMLGFSWAYLTLGAGLGALILFAVVQLVMFGFALWRGQGVPAMRWIGAGVAFGGLVLLLWPAGTVQVPIAGAFSMAVAGAAWAAYTLLGQSERDALSGTAANFVLCVPLVLPGLIWAGPGWSLMGVVTAIVAGAVTSGLGYALWYRVLPALPTTLAAIIQLSVPVIAVLGGIVFLAEPLTLKITASGGLVLGGIALSLIKGQPAAR
ncbi:DMT family transporter [Yoonia sp. R2331]|uniref:DMT family transporter n=1 Tax=Yoonia sp. R2331 TaxID=3237238 RepID=UPI0034E428DE